MQEARRGHACATVRQRSTASAVYGKPLGPIEVPRLQQGVLGLVDIATATMANIAPAMSFYFSFALIAAVSGEATPVTIIVADRE